MGENQGKDIRHKSNQGNKRRHRKGGSNATHPTHSARRPTRLTNAGPNYSTEQRAERLAAVPTITYPAELPVSARREDIAEAIKNNQVVIVAGETGSGKTTQLPKICLELGRGIDAMIGHTQPRRIAARSVAERICSELGVELGGAIGFQVRFTEEVSSTTLVKLMTDGILLAEIQADPELRRYDTIIIDEAHERSLNIDFLLGYLARLLPRRPDLKLIITSATIDSQRFAEHFGAHMYDVAAHAHNQGDTTQKHDAATHVHKVAPIVEVSGRTYPVEIRYRPLDYSPDSHNLSTEVNNTSSEIETDADPRDQITAIVDAAQELFNEGPGDILVFLSGEGEIHETQKAFRDELGTRYIEPGGTSNIPGAVEVLPLFARLSSGEQHRVFAAHRHRRIILATNIAETSITVPGIHYVIDPGTARISRYSNKTKVQRLPIEPISQASANQRSGRSGRIANGVAIRLYSEEDFASRPEFTEPEIQRTSLAAVILQMTSLGLGDISRFPFIDPPDMRAVRSGLQLLEEIGAVDISIAGRQPRLTKIGRQLARLPIDPRLGRILLAGSDNGCTAEILVLVAAMSVQDVRERPVEFKAQSDQLHARFADPQSDFLAYLNLWRYLRTQQRELSGSAFRKMCRAEYLNWLRFREWQDVVSQLRQLAKPLGLTLRPITIPTTQQLNETANDGGDTSHNQDVARAVKAVAATADVPAADAIHRSMIVGLLSNLGNWDERKRDYAGARGTHFVIWPGSGLHKRTPAWVMAAELVETSRLFARTVAQIDPAWIEHVAKHLVKKQYSEPFWSTRQGAAMVHEKVTLYGLTIVADRQVLLAKIGTPDAHELARELFIRHGLVENQWRSHHAFVKNNRQEMEAAHEVEARTRQHGLVADDAALFTFFDERVPDSIVSGRHFDTWWKKAQHDAPELLNFTQDFLLGGTTANEGDFPEEWIQGDITLPITYSFSPGAHSDGLTIDVPVTLLPQLSDEGFDWLVPGMLEELTVATIRALPKRIRRNLVPAPDVARSINTLLPTWDTVTHGQAGAPSFEKAFTEAVRTLRGFDIDDAAWDEVTLPAHLTITFRIRSERGAVLDEGTSLTALQRSLAPATRNAVENVVKGAVARALDEARDSILADQQVKDRQAKHDAAKRSEKERVVAETKSRAEFLTDSVDDLHGWPQLKGGELPAVVETQGPHAMVVRGYPAFIADSGSVALRVLAEPAEQVRDHRKGIIQLIYSETALPEARIATRWNGTESLTLAGSPYKNTAALVADLQITAVRNLADKWAKQKKTPLGRIRKQEQYLELRDFVRGKIEDETYRIAQIVVRVLAAWGEVEAHIRAQNSIALINTVHDIREQVNSLIYNGFVFATPEAYLTDLPRFLQAASYRITKATSNLAADDALAWQIADIEELVVKEQTEFAQEAYDAARAATLVQARWLVEELRVSLFAQQLGTRVKVSPQRIKKLLAE
ncbi:ATP-dependent RNA helicase HrpA [Arcanobacterium ihumii]|uniref:ATP-dependent RNA helicase HrpA n=1 Tax=Arcanobacterium ihumii TaxID=2138162 RepID=UPI001F2585E2|nr:ATP-dependent RNA helicase HrpA [Arcanobacterium ihumii]